MNRRGRPVLGALGGFLFFIAVDLLALTTGTIELGSILLAILPIVGIVLGVVWGLMAPLRWGR